MSLILALIGGGILGYLAFVSYWYAVIGLILFFLGKIVWGLSSEEKIAMGLEQILKRKR